MPSYVMGTGALARTPLKFFARHNRSFLCNSEKPLSLPKDSDSSLTREGLGTLSAIGKLCQDGQLDKALHVFSLLEKLGTSPPGKDYISFLKACHRRKALDHVKQVLEHLIHHRSKLAGALGDYLVITLVKCGGLEDALHIFHGFSQRSVYAWTAVISGFTDSGQGQDALTLHQ
eukprot:c43251_g1_i1 orf=3-521(-)